MPELFEYHQYREFLKDYYEEQKARKTGFTYARFSQKAGLGSPNYFKLVMDGEKNLTAANIIRFCNGMDLDPARRDYFEALVHFNQAKDVEVRKHYQERVLRLRERKGAAARRTLEEYEFEMLSSWVHHAVLVLTNVRGFRESPVWIQQRLFGLVSEAEISRILENLQTMGLLVRDEKGRLRQSHRQIHTRPELRRKAGRAFYEGLFARAAQSFQITPPDQRELGAYLVGLSVKQLPELRKRVRDFLADLNDWALSHSSPDQVYALVFGALPLSDGPDSGKSVQKERML